jgi:hypothetical protein
LWLEVAEAYSENIRNIEGNIAKLLRIENFLCSISNLIYGREELRRQLTVKPLARLFERVTSLTFTSGAFTTTTSEGCHPFDLYVRCIYN